MTTLTAHQLVNQDSGNSEWFTPPEIIEAAREVMGSIDLDPASCYEANQIVKAQMFYIIDGLGESWLHRNVWMNHPFSRENNKAWIAKFVGTYLAGNMEQGCCITYAATSEEWFRPLLEWPQCFLHGRTNYLDPVTLKPVKGVTKGSVVTYLGPNVARFAQVFSKLGTVKVVYS